MIGGRGPGWGVDYGEAGEIPPDALAADSDCAVAQIVAEARRAGRPVPPVVLTGGDLARTLGVAPARTAPPLPAAATGARFEVDVGAALVDGRLHWFVAHLVARRSWWRGRLLVAANASFIGTWNAAPRSHPGDAASTCSTPARRCRCASRPADACPRATTSPIPISPSVAPRRPNTTWTPHSTSTWTAAAWRGPEPQPAGGARRPGDLDPQRVVGESRRKRTPPRPRGRTCATAPTHLTGPPSPLGL